MQRKNVTFILGNHEHLFCEFIKKLGLDLMGFRNDDDRWDFRSWNKDGGIPTVDSFLNLSIEERKEIYEFLCKAKTYAVLENGDFRYILVHAGIAGFEEEKPLDKYNHLDFLYGRTNYEKRYYKNENTFLITGHTPTPFIREDRKPEIVIKNGHIAIDCGCIYGGNLAAFCIETGEATYIKRVEDRR